MILMLPRRWIMHLNAALTVYHLLEWRPNPTGLSKEKLKDMFDKSGKKLNQLMTYAPRLILLNYICCMQSLPEFELMTLNDHWPNITVNESVQVEIIGKIVQNIRTYL